MTNNKSNIFDNIYEEVLIQMGKDLAQYLFEKNLEIEMAEKALNDMGGTSFKGEDLDNIYIVANDTLKSLKAQDYLDKLSKKEIEFKDIKSNSATNIIFEGTIVGTAYFKDSILKLKLKRGIDVIAVTSILIKAKGVYDYQDMSIEIEYLE
jgi:hypothetical protein